MMAITTPGGKNYFADLGFTVSCPGMDTISAQSAYQASEFAVFTPAEAGTCTIAVMGSDIDTPTPLPAELCPRRHPPA